MIEWEMPLSVLEDNFKLDHGLEGEVDILRVDYDPSAEAIIIYFDIEDIERVPESDTDGTLLSLE
jgi:hypothetical protein